MDELKKKAVGGIKEMLEGRMVDRMKPKPKVPDAGAPEVGDDGKEDETGAMMGELPVEGEVGLELPEGADPSRLAPEEMEQLKDLYAKMGC